MSFRSWLLRFGLALCASVSPAAAFAPAAFAPAANPAAAAARHITINAPAGTTAGGMCCVFVSAPGQGGNATVEAELAGKSLPVHLIAVGDSGFIACFYVPGGTSGETVEVTASSGNSSASANIPVF